MFGFSETARELAAARNRIVELEREAAQYKQMYENKTRDYGVMVNKLREDARNASVGIDFELMEAFSVERMQQGDEPAKTVIGYIGPDNSVHEWTLFCNDNLHEKLVKEFNEYKASCQKNNDEV